MINFKLELNLETENGELNVSFVYDHKKKQLLAEVSPLEPELVTEGVYEILNWCERFLHSDGVINSKVEEINE